MQTKQYTILPRNPFINIYIALFTSRTHGIWCPLYEISLSFQDTSLTFDPKTCRAEGRSKLVLDFHLEFSRICRFGISYVQTTGSLVVRDLVAIGVLDWLAVLWPSGRDWLSSCYLGDQVQSLSFSYWFWWQLLGEIGRFTLNLGHKSCNQIRKVVNFYIH